MSALQTSEEYLKGVLEGNRGILARSITLIESTLPAHRKLADELIEKCLPYTGNSLRIGITGSPGVGKSSFIEVFGTHLTGSGKKVAVLAIDPTSQKSRGSILGDKTRMEILSNDPNAFIRPSPSASSLGGVAQKTRETIMLCEAAGFNTILVETVGVGQSETAVHSMVDFFLLLLLAGAGDELQGIKRGIMEMADAIAITKADGDNKTIAKKAQQRFKNALHLMPANSLGWTTRVQLVSAHQKKGIDAIQNLLEEYLLLSKTKGHFAEKRKKQNLHWLKHSIAQKLNDAFMENERTKMQLNELEEKVLAGKLSPFKAAEKLIKEYFSKT